MFFGILVVSSPVILAGICNMIFVKLPILDFLKTPMDAGRCFFDGKRIFGDNKTWKGFFGMIFLSTVFGHWLQQLGSANKTIAALSVVDFTRTNGALLGAVLGLGYVLAELPNSFFKRRFDIAPGERLSGWKGIFFTFLDQADSVIGCLAALCLYFAPPLLDGILFVFLFAGLHYVLNIALFFTKLKKQCG